MADFTDNFSYTLTVDGRTYHDRIAETISSVTQVRRFQITVDTDEVIGLTSTPTSGEEFDPDYVLVINRANDQWMWVTLNATGGGTDKPLFYIPPEGFIKFNFDGSGTYKVETTTGTQGTFVNASDISITFDEYPNEGAEVIMVKA